MGEKPRGNLIQELLETGLYMSTGVQNMLRTKWRKVQMTEATKLNHL